MPHTAEMTADIHTLISAFFVLSGPAFGSFIVTVADRYPNRSALQGTSICDACGARIAVRDLFPILSWIWLRGRARCCGARLPWRLLATEIICAVIPIWTLFTVGPVLVVPITLVGWSLVALSLIDLDQRVLPDIGTLGLMALGACLALLGILGIWWHHILAALLGYLVVAGLRWFWMRQQGIEAIGLGDAKLLAASGAWVGLVGLPSVILLGGMTGLAAAMLLSKSLLPDRKLEIPFGPALAFGFWVTLLYGPVL